MHQRERADAGIVMSVTMVMRVVVVMVVMIIMVMIVFGHFTQPAPDIGGLGRGIVEPALDELRHGTLAHRPDLGAGIDAAKPFQKRFGPGRIVDQVGLGEHDTVGDRHLLHRLDMGVERGRAIDRIDDGDDAIEPEGMHKCGMPHDRLQHRHRVGKAGGLDDDPRQALNAAGLQPVDQVGQRIHQFATHGAAQAAVGEFDDPVRRLFDQEVIDGDIAELVDDDRRVGKCWILEQAVEQRRLASAKEASQHRHRDRE